ncbi:MAG: zinc ribbon domain-containing protein [Deltaproteobacteria bacterium]|nr:zinc ribbon domain-containing protein [Deltaproteobacteria bacterium]
MSRSRPQRLAALAAVAVAMSLAQHAHAQQATLAGSWSAGPLIENVTVSSWVDECGPKPKSSSSPGGGYKISVSGDELVFSGGKSFRTDQCWDMGLARRVSHSATPSIRWWKTRCESPPGDPRKAAITTVVRAIDDDTIVLSESAHYSSTLAAGSCSATVERSRTFKIVSREGAAAPAPSPTTPVPTAAPTPTPKPTAPPAPTAPAIDCSAPGDPATLEVRPRKKLLRPGDAFDLKARILDPKGCELPSKPTYRLAPESSSIATISIDAAGHVKVAADAEPVSASVVVEAAGKSARVQLEVVSDKAYADLLAAGGGDAGADEGSVAIVITGSGAGETIVRDPEKPQEGRRRFGLLAVAGGAGSLLALAAVVLWRRANAKAAAEEARRAAERAERKAEKERRAAATAPVASPAAAAPDAGTTTAAPGAAPAAVPGGRICPVCRSSLPPHAEFCPNDGTRLPPAPRPIAGPAPAPPPPAQAHAPAAQRPRGRICPMCGTRYEAEAAFCSKDGASLVPLN